MGQVKKKKRSNKWGMKQAALTALAIACLSLMAAAYFGATLLSRQAEQVQAQNKIELAKYFEIAAARFESQVKLETETLGLESSQLQAAMKRLGASRLTIVSANGDRLQDVSSNDGVATPSVAVVGKLTSKAVEYGKASSMLVAGANSSQAPMLVAAAKFKPSDVNGGVIAESPVVGLVSLVLSEAYIGEQARMVGSALSKPRVVPDSSTLGDSEAGLLKTGDGILVATIKSSTSDDAGLLALLPGLIALAGILVAAVVVYSASQRQAERLNLLRKVSESFAAGKPMKLNPSGQGDIIGRLTTSLKSAIDASQSREKQLRKVAYRDLQTDLPNKMLYMERLEQLADLASAQDESFSVMVVYMHGLAETMELAGPDSQKNLMQDLASRLVLCVRKGNADNSADKRENATVARIDDNLFGVLMPNTTVHQAQGFAEAVVQNVSHQFVVDDCKVDLAAQIGIASYPEHCVAGVAIHRAAISAMQDARTGEQSLHIFGNPVKQGRAAKTTAVAKVANKNDMFDFDWDKIAG